MKHSTANKCKECKRIDSLAYSRNNKDKHAKYYQDNRDRILAQHQARKEDIANYNKEYREAHREVLRSNDKKRRALPSEKAKHLARNAKRRARKLSQTPELNEFEEFCIQEIYLQAQELTLLTGITMHVDHKEPLAKGGLHHPDNLRVLTAKENLEKGTKIIT